MPPGTWHIDDGRDVYGQWMTEPMRVIGQGREDVAAWFAANPEWAA